ncbi:cytochrome P450 9e2-like [Sitodiplosis mosellana]|uniref:cytochrome P450 9e2-like n=1 Tax=Sitodiplosis mosellana TaxID=263140 RepID=UPI00244484ED|nr:cytochrome P450 9e2-like [Sitodiplosis mosellana]
MFEFSGVTSFLLFTLVITVIVRVFYSLVVKNWNYFSERNVEFKRGLPLLGTMYPTMLGKESMAISSLNLYQKYSDRKFVGMYEIGGTPSFMVIDPDLIRDITIKDFDYFVNHYFQLDKKLDPLLGRTLFSMSNQSWRDMRTTMSPLFTGSKMRHMLTLMIEKVRDFNAYIRDDITSKTRTNGREYNTMDLMMRLTNDIISSCAFGLDTNTLKEPENEFYKMGKEIAYAIMGVKALFLLAFPKVATWLGLKILNDQHDNFFRTVIHNTIEERQKKNIVRNDMLNLLLLAKEGKLHDQNDNESDQDTGFATISEMITAKTTQKLKNWTDDDLVAQCVIFFLAGFTGVSTTFCFLCYELSLNPDIQGRLYDEITETNEQLNGKPLTFEALQRMKYLDMVVSEVLRKWPVGTMMDRAVSKQYLMEDNDGTKVLLQPNNVLWIPVFGIQRNPKFYPDPETFDPNRFNDDNKKNIHPSTYLPFGSGPRACIASRFALLQLKTVIYHILLDFKIEPSSKTPIPLILKGGTNALDPVGGFFNQLTLRN